MTLYFNDALNNGDVAELDNWWDDLACSVPATALPPGIEIWRVSEPCAGGHLRS